jgi:hypothetical protein
VKPKKNKNKIVIFEPFWLSLPRIRSGVLLGAFDSATEPQAVSMCMAPSLRPSALSSRNFLLYTWTPLIIRHHLFSFIISNRELNLIVVVKRKKKNLGTVVYYVKSDYLEIIFYVFIYY